MLKKIHNSGTGLITHCQICGNTKLMNVINLGIQPPCDSLLEKKNEKEEKFPLNFKFCTECFTGQIDYVVPPKKLFYKKYPYRSGITKTLVDKLFNTSEMAVKKLKIPKNSLCIDVGSNDGSLLKGFKMYGMKVLGVEPTDISKIANEDGIPTIQRFFNEKEATKILDVYGRAKIITATNVFAHVPNLYSIIKGIKSLLTNDGVFISESHYLINLLETLQYDSIYHEHLRYYTLNSLIKLFDFYQMEVFDVEFIKNYGGSIRVYTGLKGQHKIKKSVKFVIENEKKFFQDSKNTFSIFKKKIIKNRNDLNSLLANYLKEKKTIVGIGCPGRCSTFLNFCKISNKKMIYIAEQSSSLKLKKFLPGMRIPIIDEKYMLSNQPDLAVILSWHYADEIIEIMRKKGLTSQILIPFPDLKFV